MTMDLNLFGGQGEHIILRWEDEAENFIERWKFKKFHSCRLPGWTLERDA